MTNIVTSSPQATSQERANTPEHFDVIVIGAGSAGLYELHLLRQRGLSVRVLEAGGGVGGTWYWNRYPGARLHSESHTYQYFFDKELLDSWDWSEAFAGQPELERYFNVVADKHDMKKDIEFNTRVDALEFDDATSNWTVRTDDDRTFTAHFVVTATGPLSAPIYPDVPGIDTFSGESYHTARWPHTPVSFDGKRVAVIGTGSTGVQLIPKIAGEAQHLSVLMRTPNWVVPLNNRVIDGDEMAEIRSGYPKLYDYLVSTFGGFLHDPERRPSTDFSADELQERYSEAWQGEGFSKWFGLPYDILSDLEANGEYCKFVAAKIRERVKDPQTAEVLTPTHPFGAKPVDCESAGHAGDERGYYEVYNQDNVELVPVADNPIVEIVPEGVRTRDGLIEADMIVYATGFEAFVGSLNRIDITGAGGEKLRDRWEGGPTTLLGIQVSDFPNLFIVGGPHGKGGHGNSTRCAEFPLEWIANLIGKAVTDGLARIEADKSAEVEWTEHVYKLGNASMVSKAKSYLFGDNVPGRRRAYVAYVGALPDFVERLREVEKNDYQGFVLS
ncbi:NAD(P)/FAD-dependent oxidoreductase [Rhodococcus sp. T2V]|uniref:flavin-containing monooxygenase n=1 Tax=Rhodococcus sp. T2V TaxID=3034164 RepID=UPI0023E1E63C|nr:NAD(P)/FAD-dependent oxidoreductase [Rhodococcus sp. T2V]MDF3307173.1 NAD(P)/FAD-dependent oxidoreductase [Rhodococcus sp. T2V]